MKICFYEGYLTNELLELESKGEIKILDNGILLLNESIEKEIKNYNVDTADNYLEIYDPEKIIYYVRNNYYDYSLTTNVISKELRVDEYIDSLCDENYIKLNHELEQGLLKGGTEEIKTILTKHLRLELKRLLTNAINDVDNLELY